MSEGEWGAAAPAAPSGDQRWLSAANAADAAGLTPGTVRYWAHKGLIASRTVAGPTGEQVLVRLDEVLAQAGDEGATGRSQEAGQGPVRGAEVRRTSGGAELAPIFKTVSELMRQLTEATERAARAETKLEFLSEQAARMRQRLEEAEAQAEARKEADAAQAEAAQAEAVREAAQSAEDSAEAGSADDDAPQTAPVREPSEPLSVRESLYLDSEEGPDTPEIARVQVEETPRERPDLSVVPEPHSEPTPEAEPARLEVQHETTPAPETPAAEAETLPPPEISTEAGTAPETSPEDPSTGAGGDEEEPLLTPEQLFQSFLARLSKADAIRRGAQSDPSAVSESAEHFRQGFLKGISDVEAKAGGEHTDDELWPSQEDVEVARSQGDGAPKPLSAEDLWARQTEEPSDLTDLPPYRPGDMPPPPKRKWWGGRR
jgi:hypothetical protein